MFDTETIDTIPHHPECKTKDSPFACPRCRGTFLPFSRYSTKEQARFDVRMTARDPRYGDIYALYQEGKSYAEIMNLYQLSSQAVRSIIRSERTIQKRRQRRTAKA